MKKLFVLFLCFVLIGCGATSDKDNLVITVTGDGEYVGGSINSCLNSIMEIQMSGDVLSYEVSIEISEIATLINKEGYFQVTANQVGETQLIVKTDKKTYNYPLVVLAMAVNSEAIVDGVLLDAYGKFGTQKKGFVPTLSLPLVIENPVANCVYAIAMIDPDAGNFVHWIATNILTTNLPENASIDSKEDMIQGKNDFGKNGYGGPTPPDKTHNYIITVYALKAPMTLKSGFSYKAFKAGLKNNVLASAEIKAKYRSK